MSTEHPAPSPEPTRPRNDNTFFDWMRGLRVPRQPGWIGGVCAGIAARLGIDPIIVRGIVVVIAVLGGPALLLYAAAWLLLPDHYDRIHLQEAIRGNFDRAHAGIGVMALLSFLPIARGITWGGPWYAPVEAQWWGGAPFFWGLFWTAAVVGSIVWLVVWLVQRSNSTPTPTPTPTGASGPPGATDTASVASASSAADASDTSTTALPLPAAPEAPPHPDSGATDDDLAAWKEQQRAWKREYDGWKQQQAAGERELAQQRAAEQRRLRQEQSAERHRAAIEEHRRTRSNPVYSLVAIGLAIIAGAATALAIGSTGDATAAITGMAVSLGLLGLAIIVNGFRGKRSGGSGGVAFLLVVALSIGSFFNWANGPVAGDQITWAPTYAANDTDSRRTVLDGDVTLDLTEYFEGEPTRDDYQFGVISLFVAHGDVDVIVPSDEFSNVDAHAWTGTIETPDRRTKFGPFARTSGLYGPAADDVEQQRSFHVNIQVANGDVTITQAAPEQRNEE